MNFLRNLPPMLEIQKKKLVQVVKTLLSIDEIIDNLADLDITKLVHIGVGSSILGKHWELFKIEFDNVEVVFLFSFLRLSFF